MKQNNPIYSRFFMLIGGVAFLISTLLLLSSKKVTKENNSKIEFNVETVVSGLTMPWATAFLPNGDMLVTERAGKLRLVKDGKLDPVEITG